MHMSTEQCEPQVGSQPENAASTPAPTLIFPGLYHNYELVFRAAAEALEGREGAIAEFGVYDGRTTRLLASLGREVYAFDTFEGMPASTYDPILDSHNPPGKFAPQPTTYEGLVRLPNVHVYKGLFADTLPTVPEDLKIVLAYVDCDHYLSHKQVLAWLPRHLVTDAVLVFDDYTSCPGAHKAIDEFMELYRLGGVRLTLAYNKVIIWPKL